MYVWLLCEFIVYGRTKEVDLCLCECLVSSVNVVGHVGLLDVCARAF